MSNADNKIKDLLARVAAQQNALGTKPRASWQTNGLYKRDGMLININVIRDTQALVAALATLLMLEMASQEAAKRLGVPVKPFEWDGYPISDWEKDFKLRVDILAWEARKASLEATQKKLHALVSDEARTEMELMDIEKSLG